MDVKKIKQKTLAEIKERVALAPAVQGVPIDIDPNANNDVNPLQSSLAWQITAAMYDTTDPNLTPPFSWIQAFYNSASFVGIPGVVVQNIADPTVSSFVPFAWSGEKVFFKGSRILSTGTDRFGNTINSTLIGETPTTQLIALYAEGGFR